MIQKIIANEEYWKLARATEILFKQDIETLSEQNPEDVVQMLVIGLEANNVWIMKDFYDQVGFSYANN